MHILKYLLPLAVALLISCSGGGGGGGGAACLGSADPACSDTEYCQISSAGCGLDGTTGSCRSVPTDCTGQALNPICTCDGLTFDNECWAAQAGQSVTTTGECA